METSYSISTNKTSNVTKQSYLMTVVDFWYVLTHRSSHQRCSIRKGVLKNFTKFTGKHLCQSLFLIKLKALGLQLYLKRDSGTGVSCEFCEISKNTFSTEHLWMTASAPSRVYYLFIFFGWGDLGFDSFSTVFIVQNLIFLLTYSCKYLDFIYPSINKE